MVDIFDGEYGRVAIVNSDRAFQNPTPKTNVPQNEAISQPATAEEVVKQQPQQSRGTERFAFNPIEEQLALEEAWQRSRT